MQNEQGAFDDLPQGNFEFGHDYLLPAIDAIETIDAIGAPFFPAQDDPDELGNQEIVLDDDTSFPFKTLLDPASANIDHLDSTTADNLALALPHANELTQVIASQVPVTSSKVKQLVSSTLILANAYINAAAILRVLANRANPLAYILHVPVNVALEIIMTLAYIAPPEIRRWDGSNLGWLALYWTCSDLRRIMKNSGHLWSIVCTQLPRVYSELHALAGNIPLALRFSAATPAMPPAFSFGTAADKRRLMTVLRTTPADAFKIVACADLRLCASTILKWLAAANTETPTGLPLLERLELDAPLTFDAKGDKDAIDRFARRPFHNHALVTPSLRYVKYKNICYPFHTPQLRSLIVAYDTAPPVPDSPRPTLSNVMGLVARSQRSMTHLSLNNAIDDEDEDQVPGPLALPSLQFLDVTQRNVDIIHICISRLHVPPDCNIRVEFKLDQTEAIGTQLSAVFGRLLTDHSSHKDARHRLLRIRFLGRHRDCTRTEITWTFDYANVYRISDCTKATRTFVIETPIQFTWLSCLRAFAETLVYLHHPPIKTLILPSSSKAWEIKSFHELDTDVVRTLFIIGTVQWVWPSPRITWALGTNAAWEVPSGYPTMLNVPFAQYLEDMRTVQGFDMTRLLKRD
ncbi:unnamed protein product [Peniophora sp. CBMAI 1063]|nr:unnamed protein product [Peniophora sp. CBMAI 1063]